MLLAPMIANTAVLEMTRLAGIASVLDCSAVYYSDQTSFHCGLVCCKYCVYCIVNNERMCPYKPGAVLSVLYIGILPISFITRYL